MTLPAAPRLLLIDNYDSFTHNLAQQLGALGARVEVRRNDALSAEEALDGGYTHVVISPGPGHPLVPRDFGVCAALLRELPRLARGARVLGVCLGHQGIAAHLGGEVGRAPRVMHGKESWVRHDGSGLFAGLPSPLSVMRYHSLRVVEESLPPCLRPCAWSEDDGVLMAFEHRALPVFGVQFHPESVGTPQGAALMARFVWGP
ncbi:MAG: aminodeoxychorismate/anthranilate synthase component II [Deltaproteobacteria bacterium]|jgi:anthranilate synthase/aminodeoxychorismate synthase-like glutamine amidotransferase|nr:aminodeoxychorismate/anthranilate synthase component II [Deltaproteobacteria bacterium]